jgi:hypothetical protein
MYGCYYYRYSIADQVPGRQQMITSMPENATMSNYQEEFVNVICNDDLIADYSNNYVANESSSSVWEVDQQILAVTAAIRDDQVRRQRALLVDASDLLRLDGTQLRQQGREHGAGTWITRDVPTNREQRSKSRRSTSSANKSSASGNLPHQSFSRVDENCPVHGSERDTARR